MPSEQLENQRRCLTWSLQLLDELNYSDYDFAPTRYYDRETRDEMRILDTVAMLLSSGRPGDMVSAALDKKRRGGDMTLVLARNGPPTAEDIETTRSLLSIIMHPSTQNAADLSNFLMSHCYESMKIQMSNLHQSLYNFYLLPVGRSKRTHFEAALHSYMPKSLEEEFGRAAKYGFRPENGTVKDIMRNLLEVCMEESTFCLDPTDPATSILRYEQLSLIANILLRTRFLKVCSFYPGLPDYILKKRNESAIKLRWCLHRVRLHYSGINQLIKAAKKRFSRSIPFRWVDDAFSEAGEGEVKFDADNLDIIKEAYGPRFPTHMPAWLSEKVSRLPPAQKNRSHVNTTLHAEIRIILHFGLRSPKAFKFRGQIPIGCSEQSCLCCTLWIDLYNIHLAKTTWTTTGSHGKPSVNWALPGDIGDAYAQHSISTLMVGDVTMRFRETLHSPLSHNSNQSDDSSDPEEPDEDFWYWKAWGEKLANK